jgi:glucan phosphorylase
MNEGHAAPLVLELGFEEMRRRGMTMVTREIAADVKRRCVFTTHTPVPAGHDQFPLALVQQVMTDYGRAYDALAADLLIGETLNMTYLALEASHYVNGVARRHGEVSRRMFAEYEIDSSPTAFTSRRGRRRRCRRCSTATLPAGERTTTACAMRSASHPRKCGRRTRPRRVSWWTS